MIRIQSKRLDASSLFTLIPNFKLKLVTNFKTIGSSYEE